MSNVIFEFIVKRCNREKKAIIWMNLAKHITEVVHRYLNLLLTFPGSLLRGPKATTYVQREPVIANDE